MTTPTSKHVGKNHRKNANARKNKKIRLKRRACFLTSIPTELRLMIWEQHLHECGIKIKPISIPAASEIAEVTGVEIDDAFVDRSDIIEPSLLRVCRNIRKEALPVYLRRLREDLQKLEKEYVSLIPGRIALLLYREPHGQLATLLEKIITLRRAVSRAIAELEEIKAPTLSD